MAKKPAPDLTEGTQVGPYTLGAPLGSGGMGAVYAATGPGGEDVALKTLLVGKGAKGAAGDTRARLEREIDVCARLRHPNAVALLGHGVDPATGAPYLVMPRMRGGDLAELLARVKVLEPSVAVPLLVQACRGVAAGHAAGIVHRDVKPSNLFLEVEDGALVVKVSDFGLAKIQDAGIDSLTTSGTMLGTPHYMAPEQAENAKRADVRADVYSLAMVLYHALSGTPAFTRQGSFMSFLVGQLGVPPLQDAAPWVPPDLARVVHAALLRDPAARCPDASELEMALTMAVGWEGANAPIYPAAIAPLSAATRAQRAPRAVLPASFDELLRR